MSDHLKVYAGLSIDDGCPMRYYPAEDGDVVFVLGTERENVEVHYTPSSLSTFVALAGEALSGKPVDG